MAAYELAQLNIAHMKTALDAPEMVDFVANLDRLNALAEAAPGFIWRLKSEAGNATAIRPFGENTLVNLSVWSTVANLSDYVYKSLHVDIMKRRKEWFERMPEAYHVLWWVSPGHRPNAYEAMQRLQTLRAMGPSDMAFNFKQAFAPPV
jgi:hypothetical protein